jgi:2-keto-4-pentenoate hydratase/2-oxohepta-3-ene-1,7-dioic acid hydratase in catechol pathway
MTEFVRLASGRFARVNGDSFELLDAAPWLGGRPTGDIEKNARVIAPAQPSKIFCVGRNYGAHAKELGNEVPKEPLFFSKPPSSLLAPGGTVFLPPESTRVDYEGELAVIIGKHARRVKREAALAHVFGYTIACDVTARDLQKSDGQWTRAKGFDTFCPLGPRVVTDIDASALGLKLTVNGEVRQDGNTSDMVFDIAELIARASAFMTLEPGDLLLTGTPEGVGPLSHGDCVVVEIEKLGALQFGVATEE